MQRPIFPWASFALLGVVLASPAAAQCGVQLLTADDGDFDSFGRAVAVDGEDALVADESAQMAAGAVHAYRRVAGSWAHAAVLTAPDGSSNERFGSALALAGDRAAVGAHREAGGGAVYLYRAGATGWTFAHKLEASDPETGAYFGSAVAFDGDRLAIGAPLKDEPAGADAGAVYVFERDPVLGWVETAKLTASDAAASDRFGDAVALSGDTLAVGAYANDTAVTDGGAAYVFEKGPAGWSETFRRAGDSANAELGRAVALDGDVLALGVPGLPLAGTTLVLERAGGVWSETAALVPFDGTSPDRFGSALALDGDRLAVGAPTGSGGRGAAYVYAHGVGGWALEGEMTDPDATLKRGEAVALRGDDLLVGDPYLPSHGAACAYRLDSGIQLLAAPAALAIDAGGTQQLTLSTCPPELGATVLLLGSLSGTAPGLPLGGGLVLPLNPDAYLARTLIHPNEPPLAGSLQILDATGATTATFTLPPAAFPILVGLVAHHAFVVLDVNGALVGVSPAAPLAFVPTKTVWTASSKEPADFPSVAVALASPAVKDGDTLLADHSAGGSFALTKAVHVLAEEGDYIYGHDVLVSGAAEFTLAGVRARSLVIENVPGRGVLDACTVGGLYLDDYDGWYYLGYTEIKGCAEVLVASSWFHGDDACYPEESYAGPAVVVRASRVVFADCTIAGGNGAGEDFSCPTHYPVAGAGLVAAEGSDVTLAGTTAVGGVGPSITMPAVQLDQSVARIRGDAGDELTATAPSAAIAGTGGKATVSGVTLSGAPLPPWVVQPSEAEPFTRLLGVGVPPRAGEIHVHGPVGGAALVAVALAPGLFAAPPPIAEALWFEPTSVIALLPTTTLGQDVPVVLPLPPIPAAAGTTPIVQAWMPVSPTGLAYVTNATSAVVRW